MDNQTEKCKMKVHSVFLYFSAYRNFIKYKHRETSINVTRLPASFPSMYILRLSPERLIIL